MKRSDKIKIKSNIFENSFLVISILIIVLLLYLQISGEMNLPEFIKDLVQVNITSSLSIAALVASMGAFRWDHYRKALTEEGVHDKWERKNRMFAKAKWPLYRVIKLNSVFIIMNIVTPQSAAIKINDKNEINLYYFLMKWDWILIALIFICLIIGVNLIYVSMKYMKELIFK